MFANQKFRDVFAFPTLGIPPQLYATGSTGGGVIPVTATGNAGPANKWVFIGQTGSGAATTLWNFWVGGASASNGTFSALPATSTSTFSGSNSYSAAGAGSLVFGSKANVVMEVRAEYLQGLGSGITWIRPIMSITTASAYAALLSLAFAVESQPASLYDTVGAVFAETDAF